MLVITHFCFVLMTVTASEIQTQTTNMWVQAYMNTLMMWTPMGQYITWSSSITANTPQHLSNGHGVQSVQDGELTAGSAAAAEILSSGSWHIKNCEAGSELPELF